MGALLDSDVAISENVLKQRPYCGMEASLHDQLRRLSGFRVRMDVERALANSGRSLISKGQQAKTFFNRR